VKILALETQKAAKRRRRSPSRLTRKVGKKDGPRNPKGKRRRTRTSLNG